MQLTNLLLLAMATTALALPNANPEAEAAKKKKPTRTRKTATPSPTATNPCAGQPFSAPQCTTANVGCVCYALDLNTLNLSFGSCTGPGACSAITT